MSTPVHNSESVGVRGTRESRSCIKAQVILARLREQLPQFHAHSRSCASGCICLDAVCSSSRRSHAVCVEDATVHVLLKSVRPLFASPAHREAEEQWQANSEVFAVYMREVFQATEALVASLPADTIHRRIDLTYAGLGKPAVAWVLRRFVIDELSPVCGCTGGCLGSAPSRARP
jgi:hypothetical protein